MQKALYIVSILRRILIRNSQNPSRRVKLTACVESTISEGSPKTAAPFGAFIFIGGAPELAGVDDQSQPNRIAIASHHHRPLPSQGERIDSPHPASSRYRR
jgi:hypothetical protein